MPTYEVETDKGTFALEPDHEVADTPAGRPLLQRLVHQQMQQQAASRNTLGSLATQVVGGTHDAVQSVLDLPASIANTVTEFVSPDAPGGPRRRLVPDVQAPQLPDVVSPQTGLECGVRTDTTVVLDLGSALPLPAVRAALLRRVAPGSYRPLLFKPRAVAGEVAEQPLRTPRLYVEPGRPAGRGTGGPFETLPTPTLTEATELLKTVPSDGAKN